MDSNYVANSYSEETNNPIEAPDVTETVRKMNELLQTKQQIEIYKDIKMCGATAYCLLPSIAYVFCFE